MAAVLAIGGDEGAAGGTILVVDDDQSVLEVVSGMLRRRGYATHVAAAVRPPKRSSNGRGRVDLIVADLRMPGISGAGLVDRARGRHPRAAAIYISGHAGDRGSLPPGAALLEKPFTREQLLRAVDDALAGG